MSMNSTHVRGERLKNLPDPDEVPIVKQSDADHCDINAIMARYNGGGDLTHINNTLAKFGDFSNAQEFTDACNAIGEAESAFAAMPAELRDAMGNDPEEFLRRMEDPEYRERFQQMGAYDPKLPGSIENPEPDDQGERTAAPETPRPGPGKPIIGGETPPKE